MFKKGLLIFSILFLIFNQAFCQLNDSVKTFPIAGKLIEKSSTEEIPYMEIKIIYKIQPLTYISLLTDSKGWFQYELPATFDTLLIQINSKFYDSLNVSISKFAFLQKKNGFVGIIELVTSKTQLDEVIVTSKLKITDVNKTSYSAKLRNKSLPQITASVLRTLPGIKFENNDYILNGFKTPIYYLNNSLSSKDIIDNLSLDIIDKIEIIHNPPLTTNLMSNQYIINVVTKKNLKYALGGQISGEVDFIRSNKSYSTSYYYSTNDLLVNLSSQMYNNRYNTSRYSKWFSTKNNLINYNSEENGRYSIIPSYNSFSIQYTPKRKINIYSSVNYNKRNITFNQSSLVTDSSNFIKNIFANKTNKKENLFNSNINFKYLVNSKLTLYLLAGLTKTSNRDIIENTFNISNPINSILTLTQKSRDFSLNFNGNLILKDLTMDFSLISQNYKSVFPFLQKLNQNGNSVTINGQTNFYQTLIASTISATKQFKFGTLMLGSRIENSSYFTKEIIGNINNNKINSLNVLPKISFFKLTEKYGIFIFTYQKDVQLPNPYQLSLARISYRPNQETFGSLNLKPEINSSLNINHLFDKDKLSINSSLYFNKSDRFIGKGPYVQDSTNMIEVYSNLGSKRIFGIDLSFTYNAKPLMATASFNVESLNFNVNSNILNSNTFFFGSHLQKNNWKFKFSTNVTYNIMETFSVNLLSEIRNLNYDVFSRTTIRNPSLSLEINKTFLKQKLYSKIFWSQIFNLNKKEMTKYYSPDINGVYTEITKFQSIGISVVYSFGKSKKTETNDIINKKIENRSIKSLN
ncbi:MAG: TonB-dependent receptor [Lacibacter sp.]